jgi:osmotically-inducible protein OsmY
MDRSICDQAKTGHRLLGGRDKIWENLIRAEFENSSYDAMRSVSCQVNDGMVTLRGSVPSYYLKQVAQWHALNAVEQTAVIVNQLQVEP